MPTDASPPRGRFPRLPALLLLLLTIGAPALGAQEAGTVTGTVVAVGSAEPIPNVQVFVVGGSTRTLTDAQGRFRLATVPAGAVTVEARRIGYQPTRVTTRAGETVRILMPVSAASLEALVVTGTAGSTQRREIGNTISKVDAASVVETQPIVSMQSLINGRAPGVVVMPTSGTVGSGQQIRIRGTSSLSLGNNPLIYVDGVRVNNEVATGPISQAFGSRPISRLNDINPQDIESIEILKGPSAATLYGTEASNGVINIITKRGAAGATRWTATIRQGVNYLADWRSVFPQNYGRIGGTGDTVALDLDSLVAGNRGVEPFRDGRHQELELGVAGGTDRLNYYVNGGLLDSDGADPNNTSRRYTGRANLTIQPSPKFQIGTSVNYTKGRVDVPCEGGCGGHVWTTLLATPANYNNPRRHGYHSALPYQYDQIEKRWQDLDRFTGSVRFEHTPITWFQHRVNLGFDRTLEGNNTWFPRIDSLVTPYGSAALGYRGTTDRSTIYRSVDYSASATWNQSAALRFTTSGGAQYYHNATDYLFAEGSVFPSPGLKTIAATTTAKTNDQDFTEDKTLGVYLQEMVGWRERLFATAAVRVDDNSAFGAGFNRVVYPKFSLSWVLSEEPWFRVPGLGERLNSMRLRAAYGEAGKAPATYDALRTFEPASGPGDSPAVMPRSIGNPNLGPERGKEYELGLDVEALDNRLGLEATYYNKKTTDAILNRQIAPSVGFSGTQPFNAGSLRNNGFELTLRGTPLRSDRFGLDVTVNYAYNDNEVLSLYDQETFVSSGSFTRHAIGHPAFGFWERRVTSAALLPSGRADSSRVMCDDGRGGEVNCYNPNNRFVGVNPAAPLVYLGRSIPPHEGSLSANVTLFRNWRVTSFLDTKRGHKKVDGNTRVRCTPVIGARCREWWYPHEFEPTRIAQVQNSNLVDFLITDASFTKLREVSVAYDVPQRFVAFANIDRATLSVAGRNLKTWTKFQGFEPEAMWLGGDRGGNVAWEQTMMPQLRSWIVSLNLGF
ncbi:MAG TPA: SusC/RagA family TonB-linked outer membrane protein [Gemmatimonadaceae bacterium]|nr:SusC/RagA family TonB-linked outer membrane protein [Gemmatimonadaceae bacterium]